MLPRLFGTLPQTFRDFSRIHLRCFQIPSGIFPEYVWVASRILLKCFKIHFRMLSDFFRDTSNFFFRDASKILIKCSRIFMKSGCLLLANHLKTGNIQEIMFNREKTGILRDLLEYSGKFRSGQNKY